MLNYCTRLRSHSFTKYLVFMSQTTQVQVLHNTQLLYYVFFVAVIVHGGIVLTSLFDPVWTRFYMWESIGFLGSLLGLFAWQFMTAKQRDYLLIIPVCFCICRWSFSWIYGDVSEVYTTTISILMYFPVLVGCSVLFGTHTIIGLGLSTLLSLIAWWGNMRPEIMESALSEWRICPSIIGVYLLYTLFFLTWRQHISTLQEFKERESTLHLSLQATTAHQLASRMSVASKISGEVAHEFNNLLNVISPLCSFLIDDLKNTKNAQDIKEIQTAAERMRVLSQELLSLTQTSRILQEESDLISVITKLQGDITRGQFNNLISLKFINDVQRANLKVSGSEDELIKMIELLNEHILSLKPKERITLRLNVVGASQIIPPLEEVQRGEVAVISIGHLHESSHSVNHIQHIQPLILDYAQSELGLTAAYAIALRAGGSIRVEVTDQEQVIFKIFLPTSYRQTDSITLNRAESDDLLTNRSDDLPMQSQDKAPKKNLSEQTFDAEVIVSPHILLIDDEQMVLKVIERGLIQKGIRVTSTISSLQALEYLREDANRYDLIISDVRMPELSGPKMIQTALAEGIKLPLYLYITGHIDDQAAASLKVSPEQVLFKPFTPRIILARVHQLLKIKDDA